MLSYQHIYHAGNFADVHKHVLVVAVLSLLRKKPAPLFFLDTHAGRGLYDLSSPEAQKTNEYANGITSFLSNQDDPLLTPYTEAVRHYNTEDRLRMYPGSAELARYLLGAQAHLTLCELHPGEFHDLQKNIPASQNIKLAKKDGFSMLQECMPPKERYGAVLIDPPYEMKSDYRDIPTHLANAYKKWPKGIFMLWYPILTDAPHLDMLTQIRRKNIHDVLVSEVRFDTMPKEGFAMYGSGLAMINAGLTESAANDITSRIALHLPQKASGRVFWLDNCPINPETGLLHDI